MDKALYFLFGFLFCFGLLWISSLRVSGFAQGVADDVLNNPNVVIDTTITINQQDTVITYHFIKKD